MRIRIVLGILTLSALSPGCALPCVAVHNIQVEIRENLDEHMAGIREWWHRDQVGPQSGPIVTLQAPRPGPLADQQGGGFADGPPVLLLPSPAHGSEKPQAGSP